MGLQRKQGEVILEGQQFDIRGTVDKFRHSVNMYVFWRPGMDIYVSHVRRKQIPFYVFPDRHKHRVPRFVNGGGGEVTRKRKDGGADVKQDSPHKRQSVSPVIVSHSCASESKYIQGIKAQNLASDGGNRQPNATELEMALNSRSAADLEQNTVMRQVLKI